MVQHHGDKGSKEAHTGPVCSDSVPLGIGTHWQQPYLLKASKCSLLTVCSALLHDSYGL